MTLTLVKPRLIPANPMIAGLAAGEATTDRIAWVKLSSVTLPLHAPISRAVQFSLRHPV